MLKQNILMIATVMTTFKDILICRSDIGTPYSCTIVMIWIFSTRKSSADTIA